MRRKKRLMRLVMRDPSTPSGYKHLRDVKLNIAEYRMVKTIMPRNGYSRHSYPDDVTNFILSHIKDVDFENIPYMVGYSPTVPPA